MSWSGRGVCSRGVVVGVGLARAPFSLLADGGGGCLRMGGAACGRTLAGHAQPCCSDARFRGGVWVRLGGRHWGGHCGWVDVACVVDGWMFACVVDDVRDASSGLTG